MEFRGRDSDLRQLAGLLDGVEAGTGTTRGKALIMTGRRRVGKSRLAQEFCDRSGRDYLVFQATRGRNAMAERREFLATLTQSSLHVPEIFAHLSPPDWNGTLRALAEVLPGDRPTVVVLDEVPWLVEQDSEFEGALQTVWDQHLSQKPVLLLLIGSDLSVMEALQTYGRPFFGRATKIDIAPLNPADVQAMAGLSAADAIDAHLITGGFPEIVRTWASGQPRVEFLRGALGDPLSPLLVAGELSLLGEFPESSRSRAILEAVGDGERTFSAIAAAAGSSGTLPAGTLNPLLRTLEAKRIVETDLPLSTSSDTKNKRYRLGDPYLRFWLAFLRRAIPLVERGRGDLALDRIERSWSTWRGRAVEPLVRESLMRILLGSGWPDVEAVGGWWNRQNNPEVDLVGADRAPTARRVEFIGSVKWYEADTFGRHELDELARARGVVPGTDEDTPLVAVARSGFDAGLPLAAHWGPEEIVAAWR
ncbi:ATP-binding protein [Promicromonospora sp. NPDC050262]|uniref:ATP-binding protein n=1 Tax=Promicromonospora sp. NPDC050262 TaxID=3155036 RepID=UPI00340D5566